MDPTAHTSSTDSEENCSEGSSFEFDEETTWIEWFCNLKGNMFFVEVDEDYIQDEFNLTGLSTQVPYYEHALNIILDIEDDQFPDDQQPIVEAAAQMLYGLVHARYILTSRGMAAMLDKYNGHIYGTCQLAQCDDQGVIPIGMSDMIQQSAVKVYCPHCKEIYYPKKTRLQGFDGAYFGTSFAPLFFLTFPHLVPPSIPRPFVPRIFGFKIHKSVRENLRRDIKNQDCGDSVQND